MKKLVTLLVTAILAMACCFGMVGCSKSKEKPYEGIKKIENLADIKIGLICLHDEDSTYDKNFIDAFKAACEKTGVQSVIETGIPEGNACYEKAVEMVDAGCNIIFADSFGHEEYMLKAAKEYPDVQFCHATGTMAHTENRGNFQNAFASIYEGRYLAGVAAGMKLAAMEAAGQITDAQKEDGKIKIGYVGAWPYAEVISGYTSWFLGVRSIVENVKMYVQYTNSWFDPTAENDAATNLINNKGCALISQHADSMGAPNACETAGVPNVSYNGSTEANCPNTFIVSSKINWQPYFEYIIDCVNKGVEIEADWSRGLGETLTDGSVCLTDLGVKALEGVEGVAEKLNEVASDIKSGKIKVFDLSKFTVNGETLTSYKADVDTDADYTADTEVVKTANGITYIAESEFRSAPYFYMIIDGIEVLNNN